MKNIKRFNDQYLKCIVTNYKSTMQLLKDSGSLIVYQPLNEDVNYLYLGNELIASGYGVSTIQRRDKLSYIADHYDDDYAYHTRYIDFSFAYTTYVGDYILSYFDNYIQKDGSVSFTTIEYHNDATDTYEEASLKDIIFTGPDAQYNDIDVSTVSYINTDYGDYKINNNDNVTYLPIGVNINSVVTYIDATQNDSGGIANIKYDYTYFTNINKSVLTNTFIPGTVIDNAYYKIRIEHIYDNINGKYYVSQEGINDVITDITMAINGSRQKKYYPFLEEKGIHVYSDANIIKDHNIHLNDVKVYGKHTMFYHFSKENTQLYSNYNVFMNGPNSGRLFIDDTVTFEIPGDAKYLHMIVPVDYRITEIEFLSYDDYRTYNWTGSLLYAPYSTNKNDNDELQQHMLIGEYINYPYDAYRIRFTDGVIHDGKVILRIQHLKKETPITLKIRQTSDTSKFSLSNYEYLASEKYTPQYWINASIFPVDNDLDKYIDKISYNAAAYYTAT